MSSQNRPALLGGLPVIPEPLPPYVSIGERETEAALRVMRRGVLSEFVGAPGPYFMGGREVRALEEEWAAYFGMRHAISLNSATSGLHAALVAAGVGPGDEVIVPAQTMSATATAVVMAGGTPVFVDQEEFTACLDPEAVAAALTPRTRAIMAVNLFGGPAQLVRLRELADRHGIILVEDNAQAAGARHQGRYTGTIGHMGVFSLNFHKTIHCGEGGVVVTNDDRLARRLALVRNHGENLIEAEGWHEEADIAGYNYRMTELQAAVARVQLQRLEELTVPRIEAAQALDQGLAQFPALRTAQVAPGDRHVYYVYPIWFNPERAGLSRDLFVRALQAEGCPVVGRYVKPLYHLPLFRRRQAEGRAVVHHPSGLLPQAERAYGETLLYTTLIQVPGGKELVDSFVAAVAKVLAHAEELNRTWAANPGPKAP